MDYYVKEFGLSHRQLWAQGTFISQSYKQPVGLSHRSIRGAGRVISQRVLCKTHGYLTES